MIKDERDFKLNFEMVPPSVWCSNLRSYLPKEAWDVIRKKTYSKSGGKCSICGSPSNRLEAHEQWKYDIKTKTQTLTSVIAVCPLCHSVLHIGRTQLCGDEDKAISHYCKVNDCNYVEYRKRLGEANKRLEELSKVDEWKLDVSYLSVFDK